MPSSLSPSTATTATTCSGADVENGGSGDDSLTGGSGDDTLNGGDGNDAYVALGGTDTVTDPSGDDVILLTGTPANDAFSVALRRRTDLAGHGQRRHHDLPRHRRHGRGSNHRQRTRRQRHAHRGSGHGRRDSVLPGATPDAGTVIVRMPWTFRLPTWSSCCSGQRRRGPLIGDRHERGRCDEHLPRGSVNEVHRQRSGPGAVRGITDPLTINGLAAATRSISITRPRPWTGITVNGGDPTGSDTVTVNGTAAADAVSFAAHGLPTRHGPWAGDQRDHGAKR